MQKWIANENMKKKERELLKQKIDEKFLSTNTRIRNALKRAKIETYGDLYKRARQKYNLYYVTYLGRKSIQKIQQHLNEKGLSLPNYEKNLNGENE
jgi:DNA-directed RNA polymerase alpha subunit